MCLSWEMNVGVRRTICTTFFVTELNSRLGVNSVICVLRLNKYCFFLTSNQCYCPLEM